jgi:hypothetical protein
MMIDDCFALGAWEHCIVGVLWRRCNKMGMGSHSFACMVEVRKLGSDNVCVVSLILSKMAKLS